MNFNDPKLTAYALGELESDEDRALVEGILRDHPELAAEVEETRAVAKFLRSELRREQGAVLTAAQRDEVFAAALLPANGNSTPTGGPKKLRKSAPYFPRLRQYWIPSAVAATVVLGSTIALLWEMKQAAPSGVTDAGEVLKGETLGLFSDSSASRGYPAPAQSAPATDSNSNVSNVPSLQTLPDAPPAKAERLADVHRDSDSLVGKAIATPRKPAKKAELPSLYIAPASAPAAPPIDATLSAAKDTIAQVGRVSTRRYYTETSLLPSTEPRRREKPVILERAEMLSGGRVVLDTESAISNTESYDSVTDNAFLTVTENPLSTFSIDVDTASYSNVRRFLTSNQRPPKGAVRIEELINYFPYTYPAPQGTDPFSCTMEVGACPWTPQHRLVRVGLKGRDIAKEKLPPSNLVFLIDVSGSMQPANKLPLVQECMEQLVSAIREQDTVGIVVYAGSGGTVLEPTSDKAAIREALDRLQAGGGTNGASGIQGAYALARRSFKKEGNNRVILCTDGDFNIGTTSQSELVDLIQREAKSGVFLSVLGFGMGNTKDSTMEKLADKGNGNYAYIDSLKEGRKVLVEQMAGTLFTIAKDVKIQVEFNPAKVSAYRLLGYENRMLAKEDFNDDTKDAGEIGAGHTVTALYEITPTGVQLPTNATVDPLKYRSATSATGNKLETAKPDSETASELLTLKLRFKQPDGETSILREFPLIDGGAAWEKSSTDFRWAAAVASFGMLLRDSPHRGNASWDTVAQLANEGKGEDANGYRAEFLQLVEKARQFVPVAPPESSPQPPKGPEEPRSRAAAMVLPEFELTDMPILDAIDALSKKSRELDPDKKGVSIVFSGGSSGAQNKVSLRMRNTSVLDTAKAIAIAAGLTLQEQGDVLILQANRQP